MITKQQQVKRTQGFPAGRAFDMCTTNKVKKNNVSLNLAAMFGKTKEFPVTSTKAPDSSTGKTILNKREQ